MSQKSKNPGLAGDARTGVRKDLAYRQIASEAKSSHPQTQPVAIAAPLGTVCHAVRVHHAGGAIEHRGLFSDAAGAALAARELNRLIRRETAA